MKRFVQPAAAVALLTSLAALTASAQGSFDKSLSNDRRILHALGRLTFGPRPGDAEEVRRLGGRLT